MSTEPSIRDIIDFWYLPLGDERHGKPRDIWWKSTPEFDAEIAARYGTALDLAIGGALDSWVQSPEGALALIVLSDQFPRNIHRRSAQAYSGDAKALWAARLAVARFYPSVFNPTMRSFFYTPFHHSEALADQELACALFGVAAEKEAVNYARGHRDVVARFGRFPHRNDVLGRPSTEDELEYLKTADRYGQ